MQHPRVKLKKSYFQSAESAKFVIRHEWEYISFKCFTFRLYIFRHSFIFIHDFSCAFGKIPKVAASIVKIWHYI